MPIDLESVDLRDTVVQLLNGEVETEKRDGGTEIFVSGRKAFDIGTGARVAIEPDRGHPHRVVLERPLYSNGQLYVATNDRTLFITDFFGAALSWLPLQRRIVSDEHLLDYLLFRTVPGTGTLIKGIHRIGQGERVEWQRGHGWSHCVQRFPSAELPGLHDDTDVLDLIDAALVAATSTSTSNSANLFSGGVDSTLLQYYLGSATPTVNVAIDSPEFQPELKYATTARKLVGARGQEIAYPESEYRFRLEDSIRALRLPPHHLQTVTIDAGYSSSHEHYYTAQFADALFGLGFAGHAQRSWFLRATPALRHFKAAVPGTLGRKFRTLQQTIDSLRRPANTLNSYANTFAVYSDPVMLRRIFGDAAVNDSMQRRLDYTLERLGATGLTKTGLEANLELGHWIDFLCDDTVMIWGQLALARRKQLIAPFTHPKVIAASISIPAATRYARRGVPKHWLKRLLLKQVPAYPINQQKYSSGLPFWRYYQSGPLAHALHDYERPSFLPVRAWNELDRSPTWLTWNVFTFLTWDKCVRIDDNDTYGISTTHSPSVPGITRG